MARSAEALIRLAAVLTSAEKDGSEKLVRLGHLVNNGMLSILLYGFPILDTTPTFEPVDVAQPGTTLTFAVIANHPVELQVQIVLSFLSDFIGRQEYLAQHAGNEDAIRDLDLSLQQIDRVSTDYVVDDLGEGWESAAERVARRASDARIRLHVTYDSALLPTHDAISARIPLLHHIYDTFSLVRQAIDNTVGAMGGREPQIFGRGGRENIRALVQQQVAASSIRRYMNHGMRDALVCGNGYLVVRPDEPFNFYNLPPADTVITGSGAFGIIRDGVTCEVRDKVFHVPGLTQPGTPYGISLLEPFVGSYMQALVMERAARVAEQIPPNLIDDNRLRWKMAVQEMRERVVRMRDDHARTLLSVPLKELGPPRRELYFAGYELYE
jgi:hypothetical protein